MNLPHLGYDDVLNDSVPDEESMDLYYLLYGLLNNLSRWLDTYATSFEHGQMTTRIAKKAIKDLVRIAQPQPLFRYKENMFVSPILFSLSEILVWDNFNEVEGINIQGLRSVFETNIINVHNIINLISHYNNSLSMKVAGIH